MIIYTFIHPTKSGGTAIENYFEKYYSNYIIGIGHSNKCTNDNNPIIVVRDVKSRFLSMYKYWKNGSIDTNFKCNNEWKEKSNNISILEFINILKNNKTQLYNDFIWHQHFDNTTTWIENTEYKNIIIIKYDKNLNDKIQKLINLLDIPNKNIQLPIENVSIPIDNEDELNHEEVNNFIAEYFKDDIQLLNTIENNPELFKLVI
jgi:hypothetical protein